MSEQHSAGERQVGSDEQRGPVAYMAKNGVAANLFLFFLLFAGIFSLGSLVQEVFPEFSLDTIQISVIYPGATPEEVEESIVRKIEEQIEAVDGIKEITASASEPSKPSKSSLISRTRSVCSPTPSATLVASSCRRAFSTAMAA